MTIEAYAPVAENGLQGFGRLDRKRSPLREKQVNSAVMLMAGVMSGQAPYWYLAEAIAPSSAETARIIESRYPGLIRLQEGTTSDFPYLMGDVLDRMMLANYQAFPSPWRSFVFVRQGLRDFRAVRDLGLNGAEGVWDSVGENAEMGYAEPSEANYSYSPKKYAKAVLLSFEQIMNDDLGAFQTIPERLGRGGARTIGKFVTGLYVDASGPHASLYTSGNGNIVTSNPALSVAGLGTAFGILGGMKDSDGEPIIVDEAVLSVPPALRVTANNIMNQLTVDVSEVGGTTKQVVKVNNWIAKSFRVEVDPYIPIVASTANGSTSWFLFADPRSGRPALEVGFVRGFENPVLYQKLADTVRIGGGVDQGAGDFRTMSQQYKGVLAFGGARIDPKATVGSNGSGS